MIMEPSISSDDSCDSETRSMKKQLTEFGFEEENLSKSEMSDILKALRNSECSVEEELTRQTINETVSVTTKSLKRRSIDVEDRRMPWSIFPEQLTQTEKAQTLAIYIKLMSINNYHQARKSGNFATWPPPIQIIEESRVQPIRSTRSGRSVPIYADFDDDSSDLDFVITKTKKRKVSNSEYNANEGVYSNKVVSLKRKPSKDEDVRPSKEAKVNKIDKEIISIGKNKRDLFSLIED
ncbi:uncharacterized protein LOC114244829 [Bombyx mandarina]|uniref:Uncharacterized protein LOC114244829 n=1 Tax=Bombyx mandarina TaxID=7092 RepID=A0A6J2JSK6_BOMMA|nr:uncharacterized protein LOC114244829 [Bombyx mandarina]